MIIGIKPLTQEEEMAKIKAEIESERGIKVKIISTTDEQGIIKYTWEEILQNES